jgi:hypothetical protein
MTEHHSETAAELMRDFHDRYYAELLRQFDQLLALQKSTKGTPESDALIHARAVELIDSAVAFYGVRLDAADAALALPTSEPARPAQEETAQ